MISERLREDASVPEKGWPLLTQAADTIDALVAALEAFDSDRSLVAIRHGTWHKLDAALALARGERK